MIDLPFPNERNTSTINDTTMKIIEKSLISLREQEILFLIAKEYSTEDMAAFLHLSAHTIFSHRKSLLRKLEVKNTAGLIRKAFEYSLLYLEDGSTKARYMQQKLGVAV